MDFEPWQGVWMGSWTTWLEPDEVYGQSPFVATVDSLHDGLGVAGQYHAVLDTEVSGYLFGGPTRSGWSMSWIDTFHTNGLVMTSLGETQGDALVVSSDYLTDGETWTWSSEYRVTDSAMWIRHFNQGPGSERYLAVEVQLSRAAD